MADRRDKGGWMMVLDALSNKYQPVPELYDVIAHSRLMAQTDWWTALSQRWKEHCMFLQQPWVFAIQLFAPARMIQLAYLHDHVWWLRATFGHFGGKVDLRHMSVGRFDSNTMKSYFYDFDSKGKMVHNALHQNWEKSPQYLEGKIQSAMNWTPSIWIALTLTAWLDIIRLSLIHI